MLVLREDRFEALDKLKEGSLVVHTSIGASPVRVQPPLPLHSL
jgi:hypothetical protein